MGHLPDGRSELGFPDGKPPYTPAQAAVEANRCLFCHDAPCVQACPSDIDIPGFIRKIATGNLKGSAATIFRSNILGMSCARVCPVEVLCVGDCVYNEMGVPPIQIGRLQQHATDAALANDWQYFEAGPDTGRSVGLVGGGPASLACAHRLRRFGHRVTLYEKRDVLGGLDTWGVAPYKLMAEEALREIDWLLRIGGVEVKTGVSVPDQVGWDELLARHDALFLGFGLGEDTRLEVGGSELEGVWGAVEWIEQMKLGRVDLAGVRRAVVLGGGNTAMDGVRELLGLGVEEVTLVYRGTEEQMSGYAHEWSYAKDGGARAAWRSQPVGFEGAERLTGVRCLRTGDDRRPIPGTAYTIEADLALLAIGQHKLAGLVAGLEGVEVSRQSRVVVDAHGRTGNPRVFAGGDLTNGGKEVVNAVAEGRDAAIAIHQLLTGGQ
ncbi:MAG TPA: NAD(P)-dependent oxidoreductase [Myxococcota bacterium]|nr:NAD(P)-dependent oxidoreductase [Myxococcota bacterium]